MNGYKVVTFGEVGKSGCCVDFLTSRLPHFPTPSQRLAGWLIDAERLFEAGDGKLFFAFGWTGGFEGIPTFWVSFGVEFFRWVNHGDVFADVEHREVGMAVGVSMAAGEDGSGCGIESFWEEITHFSKFVYPFIITADDVGEEFDTRVNLYRGAVIVVES